MECDDFCANLGIPAHLHRCEREAQPKFAESELLFRRIKLPCDDFALRVSFKRKNSSTNRSAFSKPQDVLWDDEGIHHSDHGVISFPVSCLNNTTWSTEEKQPVDFKIAVVHVPLRCNYAHSDFRFRRGKAEIADLTPKSVKIQIRETLGPLIKLVSSPEPT